MTGPGLYGHQRRMTDEWKAIVTAVVAVYGAVLSTVNLFIGIRQHRTRVKVVAKFGVRVGGAYSIPMVTITTINTGAKPVVIDAAEFELPDRKHIYPPAEELPPGGPYKLDPGASLQFYFPLANLKGALQASGYLPGVRLRPFCTDQAGRRFTGKRIEIGN